MLEALVEKKEKKVEYVELIYDLIFVYMIGRNNALLHVFSNGFIDPKYFLAYIMTTLAVIQIWNFTTYYINIYGRHDVREHIFLFVNMFLLYFVGEGTRENWQDFHTQYHVAWALILVNIGLQYMIEWNRQKDAPANRSQTMKMAVILFMEAAIVLSDIAGYRMTGMTWLSLAAILFGMFAVLATGQKKSGGFVDFTHLSERAMLYVVFTFGEMIICLSGYFDGDFNMRSLYFALMGFLIVVGLFLSYGMFYDHIIDREKNTNGLMYMLLHIVIIFALNNITNGLEFMQEEEIDLIPKILFLVVSFILYFLFLFALGLRHGKARCRKYDRLCLSAVVISAVFIAAMFLLREYMLLNIALTVVYNFLMFLMIYRYGKKVDALEESTPA
ncbi:MAG: low temperature requirement protein A [Eubacterium sp.]|nr:low temperature requirement protein A [Eubacterium sp.]